MCCGPEGEDIPPHCHCLTSLHLAIAVCVCMCVYVCVCVRGSDNRRNEIINSAVAKLFLYGVY